MRWCIEIETFLFTDLVFFFIIAGSYHIFLFILFLVIEYDIEDYYMIPIQEPSQNCIIHHINIINSL